MSRILLIGDDNELLIECEFVEFSLCRVNYSGPLYYDLLNFPYVRLNVRVDCVKCASGRKVIWDA